MLVLSRMKKGEPEYDVPNWSTGTNAEIVNAIQKHYDGDIDLTKYWSIGDERQVKLSSMTATYVGETHASQYVTLVLTNVGGKLLADGITECIFQVDQKDCLDETGYMHNTWDVTNGWSGCARRQWCNEIYYNSIPESLRSIFKQFINQTGKGSDGTLVDTTDYFALRAEKEIIGTNTYSANGEGTQIQHYDDETINKIKKVNGSVNSYWLRSPKKDNNDITYCYVTTSGDTATMANGSSSGIAPFGVI